MPRLDTSTLRTLSQARLHRDSVVISAPRVRLALLMGETSTE